MRVKLSEAAWLVHRHERIVRWHILPPPTGRGDLPARKVDSVWQIDTDDLERVPGWHVDPQRLQQLVQRDAQTAEQLSAKVARLEAELQTLRARVRTLEALQTATTTTTTIAPVDALAGRGSPVDPVGVESYVPPAFSLKYTSPAASATFRTHTDASRWLDRHGVPINTSKGWPGWRQVVLEPRAVLQDALSRFDPENWRISWRLHQCDDVLCVCRELLP
jgi:hypothetical protein